VRVGWIYALVVVGLFIGTQDRNRVWADDEALWTDTVEKNPTSGRAYNNLALVHLSRGQYAKSVEYLERCEQYWNSYMYCPLNRGIALQALGGEAEKSGHAPEAAAFYDKAEGAFKRAYELNPRSVHSNFHLGQFYQDVRKDYAKAIDLYRVSVEVTGGRYPAAEARMASCYTSLKRPQDAVPVLAHALEVEPDNENVIFEKGRAEFESKDLKAAAATYQALIQKNPGHVQGWYNLGVVLLALNDLPGARHAFEQTVAIDPGSRQGLFNLSFVAEKMGDGKAAVDAMQKMVALEPAKPDLQTRLAQLRKRFGATL
jgi:tetratricopeptide (TPR) repeat protein